jgi:hypothetical protein
MSLLASVLHLMCNGFHTIKSMDFYEIYHLFSSGTFCGERSITVRNRPGLFIMLSAAVEVISLLQMYWSVTAGFEFGCVNVKHVIKACRSVDHCRYPTVMQVTSA